ncbi:MAG: alkaline phosphatase family protein [Desulfurivibrionaceae bacterium]
MENNQGQRHGLIMIQIDGLSRPVLKRALKEGRMPFLSKLLERGGYRFFPFYPGVPSTTPRFQGELFYGAEMVIPAFSFRDHISGRILRLYDPEAAGLIEKRMEKQCQGLLKGGSSYANIYCGGSEECHFCTVSFGQDRLFRKQNMVKLPLTIYRFFRSLLKSSFLMAGESALAFFDFFRGVLSGYSLYKELKFIPSRVAISLLLRDMVRDSVIMDIRDGRPFIHLNFLGYDEHSHRRGPDSLFALKTLKGIDSAIARIWRNARKKGGRKYSFWIYSDHGQEKVVHYESEQGRTLREAVDSVLNEYQSERRSRNNHPEKRGIQSLRYSLLGGRLIRKIVGFKIFNHDSEREKAVVTAVGPLGHIYLTKDSDLEERRHLGRALVEKAAIPLVLTADGNGRVVAWNRNGEFVLPDQPAEVLGADHRYLQEVTADLIELCYHKDAGTFVISGWRPGGTPLSFPIEQGAHGGPGYQETDAFAMLPRDLFPENPGADYISVDELRRVALSVSRNLK